MEVLKKNDLSSIVAYLVMMECDEMRVKVFILLFFNLTSLEMLIFSLKLLIYPSDSESLPKVCYIN